MATLFQLIIIVLCAIAGWNRAPWPIPLVVGGVIGALIGFGGYISGWVDGARATTYVVSTPIVTTAVYWIARGIRWIKGDPPTKSPGAHRSTFNEIDANLRSLEIDEIKKQLEPLMIGYAIESPIFDPGAFVYRARLIGPTFNKAGGIARKDLIYPPANVAPLGRLNRAGQPVFYCSIHKESVFFEIPDLKAGDEIVLTFWKTTEKMYVNNIGYTEYAFQQLDARRAPPKWGSP